jgi:hypothetical protein
MYAGWPTFRFERHQAFETYIILWCIFRDTFAIGSRNDETIEQMSGSFRFSLRERFHGTIHAHLKNYMFESNSNGVNWVGQNILLFNFK